MSEEAASAAAPAAPMSAQDLLLPIVPSVITSLILEAVSSLSGTAKIGVAAALSLGLWGMTRKRPTARPAGSSTAGAATGGPASAGVGGFVRKHWKGVLAAIALVAAGAVLVTRFVFGRPTIATALIAFAVLAVTVGLAYAGRRLPGAAASALAGGMLGLCLGIAFL
jgi:small-conductance mechanosensitive channel